MLKLVDQVFVSYIYFDHSLEFTLMTYLPPKRRFESTGYVNPKTAYYVPFENVTNADKEDMKTMFDNGRYFSIFAPRQSGKTTFFRTFAKELESNSDYIFILMSFENCVNYTLQKFYGYIQSEIYEQLIHRLKSIHCHQLESVQNFLSSHELIDNASFYNLFKELNIIITQKKIVIFIDEFDGIPVSEIENFLTTIRKLYQKYKESLEKALYSVSLVGIRNITQLTVGGVSPFNIADHVEIPPFTLKNVRDLYKQYTQETNQPFLEEAVNKVYEQTQGQPWLVNRLGSILTNQIRPKTTDPITKADVENALDVLLSEDNNHFNNLTEKVLHYYETFKQVSGGQVKHNVLDKAQSFLRQYGVIKIENKQAVVANPIYYYFFQEKKQTKNRKKKLFISYCHKDKDWLNIIMAHLKSLEYENIDIWLDEKIQAGEQWNPAILDAIQTSHMIICLISKDFLNADYIRTKEVPEILNKQKEGIIVFPVLLNNCSWKVISWLKDLQMFPDGSHSLETLNDKQLDDVLIKLVDQVYKSFQKTI